MSAIESPIIKTTSRGVEFVRDWPGPAQPRGRVLRAPIRPRAEARGWGRIADSLRHLLATSLRRALAKLELIERCAPRRFFVRRESLAIRRLEAPFDGLRLVHITDLHCGPYTNAESMRLLMDAVWAEQPDLIVLTGDTVDREPGGAAHFAAAADGRPAPPLGAYAILGNHDHYDEDARGVARILEHAGFQVLINGNARLQRQGAELWLAGVDDPTNGALDFAQAVHGIPPKAPKILLCHHPDLIAQARDYGFDLTLAGHTHGGQVRLPILGPVANASRNGRLFTGGTVRVGPALLHVSRGVGVATYPIRLFCPPEFSVLTLRSPQRRWP